MAFPWNPRRVLDCYPDTPQFHCSGITSKGVRCSIDGCFRKDLLREASQIIDNLPRPEHFRNDPAQLVPTLRRLAFCTLCPRWHQLDRPNHRSQVESVANAWLRTMIQLAAQRPHLRSNNGRAEPVWVRASTSITPPSTLAVSRPARGAGASGHYPSPPPSPSAASIASSSGTSNGRYTPSQGTSSLQLGSGPSSGHYPTPPSSRSTTPSSSNSTPSRRSLPGSSAPSTPSSSSSSSSLGPSSTVHQAQNSEFGSLQVDVNVLVNIGGQHRHQRSHQAPHVTSSNNTDPSSPSRRTFTSSSNSPTVGDTVVIARHYLEAVLNRIAALEALISEGSNQNSRASSRSSSQARDYDRSHAPSPSTITNFSIPPPIDRNSRVSGIEAALRRARNGPLSISTNHPLSTSTPLSSGTSTPTPSSPEDLGPIVNNNRFAGLPRRRPIDNTSCYVCYEIIDHPEDATWCRNGCGQNVCLECFETWRAHQESQGHAITCGFCRAPWRV